MTAETTTRIDDDGEAASSRRRFMATWSDTKAALESWYAARRARETALAARDETWARFMESPVAVGDAAVEATRQAVTETREAERAAHDRMFELLLRVRSEAREEARSRE